MQGALPGPEPGHPALRRLDGQAYLLFLLLWTGGWAWMAVRGGLLLPQYGLAGIALHTVQIVLYRRAPVVYRRHRRALVAAFRLAFAALPSFAAFLSYLSAGQHLGPSAASMASMLVRGQGAGHAHTLHRIGGWPDRACAR